MPSVKTPTLRAATAVGAALLLVAGALLLALLSPGARAATTGQLQQQISGAQGRVSTLQGDVNSASAQVNRLGSGIAALQSQVNRLQGQLYAAKAKLLKLQSELTAARTRLAQLEAAETRDESVLSQQLVGTYEADRPDLVSVVLEATGFNNLLERLAFAQRIGNQDTHIVSRVKADRRAVAAEAERLGTLTVRAQRLASQILTQRNSVDRARLALVSQQLAALRVRNAKAGQLASARQSVSSLQGQLAKVQAAQAAAAAQNSGNSGGSSGSSGSAPSPSNYGPPSSGGGFVFPLPKSAVSPPSTWSLDDGVDMAAPGGTPEYAVCAGTIVLHGIGGFGPSAPVLRCDSPIDGYDYVYYGHAGPGNWTPIGTHVSAGQVISEIGYGIVGISTGPHVEMGFADSSGSPIGPGSAPTMMSLLRASY
jgi:murein DD-endopeptidase MepM/ murein hydrolase activator NlpD